MFYYMKCTKKVRHFTFNDIFLVIKSTVENNSVKIIDKPSNITELNEKLF